MGQLKARANSISERAASRGLVGFDPSLIIQILPSLLGLFASCKKKPTPPTPPASADTDAKLAAWENSFGLKCEADEAYLPEVNRYHNGLLNRTAHEIKREKKANGEQITKAEKRQLAIAALDEAREMTHEELYEASLEAQGAEDAAN